MAQVTLKRLAVYKGNPYYAGVYDEKELPPAILNDPDLIVRPNDGSAKTPSYHQSLKEQTVKVGAEVQNQKKSSYTPTPPAIVEDPEPDAPPPRTTRVSVLKDTASHKATSDTASSKKSSQTEPEEEAPPPAKPNQTKSKLDINSATVDELGSLDSITVTTANKVVEERLKKPFADFEDLDKRVPLKGNRKWESFSDRLSL